MNYEGYLLILSILALHFIKTAPLFMYISLQPEILDNNLTNARWFYDIKYNDIQLFIDRIPDSWLNRTIWYRTSFSDCIYAPHEVFLRSSVYVAEYSYVFLTKEFDTYETSAYLTFNTICHQFTYHHRNTVGRYKFGVQYVQFYHHFGHLIQDFLSAMMYVPKYYYDVGFVVLSPVTGKHLTEKYLRYLGLNKHITVIDFNPLTEQVFVERLLVISSLHYGNGYVIGGLQRLRQLVFKRFNLNNITPHQFAIINRHDVKRRINNLEELYNNLTLHVPTDPGEQWIIKKMDPDNFTETVKSWSIIKCLVAPGGSALYNCIAMQPGTGILVMLGCMRDLTNVNLCSSLNISLVEVTHIYMSHDNSDPNIKCSIPAMISGCKALLELIRNGITYNTEFEPVKLPRFPDILQKELRFLNGTDTPILSRPMDLI